MYLYHFYNSNNQSTIFSIVSMEHFFYVSIIKCCANPATSTRVTDPLRYTFNKKCCNNNNNMTTQRGRPPRRPPLAPRSEYRLIKLICTNLLSRTNIIILNTLYIL